MKLYIHWLHKETNLENVTCGGKTVGNVKSRSYINASFNFSRCILKIIRDVKKYYIRNFYNNYFCSSTSIIFLKNKKHFFNFKKSFIKILLTQMNRGNFIVKLCIKHFLIFRIVSEI